QLVFLSGAVAAAVSPGRFGVSAVPAFGRRGAGEGFEVAPVDSQRAGGVLVPGGDAGFQERVEEGGEVRGRAAVGVVFTQRGDDQVAGALGLPVGQQVRAVLPAGEHAEADAVGLGKVSEGLCTRVRWAGRWSAWVSSMPISRVRARSWRGRTPAGSSASIRPATCERSMISSSRRSQNAGL